jgi:phage-related protein
VVHFEFCPSGQEEKRPDDKRTALATNLKRVRAIFFKTEAGNQPLREWLKSAEVGKEDRKRIGEDIMTVEFGWPIGMPTCRHMGAGLHEIRTDLPSGRTARVLFYIDSRHEMVLLHGFMKKTGATPQADLALARKRQNIHKRTGNEK